MRHSPLRPLDVLAAVLLALPATALAATQPTTRDEIASRAASGLGYSYWYGHGRWRSDGQSKGSCSASSHSGDYGADSSGFATKVWQVPLPSGLDFDDHPFSTFDFYCGYAHWTRQPMTGLQKGDLAVYRDVPCASGGGTRGHVVVYDKPASAGNHWVWEARGCESGIVHDQRKFGSAWIGVRRDELVAGDAGVPVDPRPEEVATMAAVVDEGASSTALDSTGAAWICGRAPAGFACYRSDGTTFAPSLALGPPLLFQDKNAETNWGDLKYGSTLRTADLDGDGLADVCGRKADGIHCWLSSTQYKEILGPPLSDSAGWGDPAYYSTLRVADVNGDRRADLCARYADGGVCWLTTPGSDGGVGSFQKIDGPPISDDKGYAGFETYSTLRMADLDGDAKDDVCIRTSTGFTCWISTGTGFASPLIVETFNDIAGWGKPEYYTTLRLADVNGDGRADICGRAPPKGVWTCWLNNSPAPGSVSFGPGISSGAMGDESGWNHLPYYSTIRMGDVNGDGALDVCARGAAGVFCWLWDSPGHRTRITGPAWSNSLGWDRPEQFRTIRLADFDGDGKADLCSRSSTGIVCANSTGTGFGPVFAGAPLSDGAGWSGLDQYPTLRATSPRKPVAPCASTPEVCDGRDNDCNGMVDDVSAGCAPPPLDGGTFPNVLADVDAGDLGEGVPDGGLLTAPDAATPSKPDSGSPAGPKDAGAPDSALPGGEPTPPASSGCGTGGAPLALLFPWLFAPFLLPRRRGV